jgi:hypothetical protein
MDKDYLVLKRAYRPVSGVMTIYDVLAGGVVVGRILKSAAAPWGCRGSERWPTATTKIARPSTAMSRRATPP